MSTSPPTFDVDLGELRAVLAELAACQRDLVGIAADAQVLSYASWRDGCAEMVTALAGLRSIVMAADESSSRAASANVEMWGQVSA